MPNPAHVSDPAPTRHRFAPPDLLVLCLDLGYSPDRLFALVAASRLVGHLVVVTTDEVAGLRAGLARRMLELLGRGEVEVIEGIDLGGERRFLPDPGQVVPDYLFPPSRERLERDESSIDRLADLLADTAGRVHWAGTGPMTELSCLRGAVPDMSARITVTRAGAPLDTGGRLKCTERAPGTNSPLADLAPRRPSAPRLVLDEHTDIDLTGDWALIRALGADSAPGWARLLSTHVERWFARGHGRAPMSAPLVLSAALGHPFVTFDDTRPRHDLRGRVIRVSETVDREAFLSWLVGVISW
ncbi:hypothetical protein ACWEKT_26860 [Nocardia takedensis]